MITGNNSQEIERRVTSERSAYGKDFLNLYSNVFLKEKGLERALNQNQNNQL